MTRSIGFYARGCLAGAKALPIDGETWQVMRLSRNRNWGHPAMIAFLERFSRKAAREGVWPGILVGDISQPRGGPMLTGHASHQIGLDADVWLTPMPDHTLSRAEREEMSALDMVSADGLSVDPAHWSARQAGVIKAAAEEPEVEQIFVNAAIKKALCETAAGEPWMNKVRPYWGHNYHFHIRIACPAGDAACQPQDPVPPGDGCDKSLELVVHRRGAASAHRSQRQAQAADHAGAIAARMPARAVGEIALEPSARAAGATADPIGEREQHGGDDERRQHAGLPAEVAVRFDARRP